MDLGTFSRLFILSIGLIGIGFSSIACEGDALVSKNPTEFPDCNDDCPTGRLDAGTGMDAGTIDSGTSPNPSADAGTNPSPDAGTLPPPNFLSIDGQHRTEYSLNLSSYLFGISSLAGPLDTIDQALAGRVNTGFGFIDDLIIDIIDNYIPQWVTEVVGVLNTAANLFNDIRVRGLMTVTQEPVDEMSQALAATESWNTLTVMIIDGCAQGRSDPLYPSCAENPIPIGSPSQVGALEVGVQVEPFTGTIDPGIPQATFMFTNREVQMEIRKLLTLAIDIGIRIATDGEVWTLDEAIDRSIDCVGFAADGAGIVEGLLGAATASALEPVLEVACQEVKQYAKQEIMNRIDAVGIDWQVLEMDQAGLAIDRNNNYRADTIQDMANAGSITGRFRAIGSSTVDGIWQGTSNSP